MKIAALSVLVFLLPSLLAFGMDKLKAEICLAGGVERNREFLEEGCGVNYRARSAAGRLRSTRNNSGESVVSTLKPSSRAI